MWCSNSTSIGKAVTEVETLRRVKHDFIVKIIAADRYEDSRGGFHVLILTEYCSAGGNLNDRLSQPSREEKTLKWLSQIASALSYLHSLQIVHRDVCIPGFVIFIVDFVLQTFSSLSRRIVSFMRMNP